MTIELVAKLTAACREDSVAGGFVSYCPALKVYAHGPTGDEAIEALKSTVSLFLGNCLSRGTLNGVLERAGFVASPEALHCGTKVEDIQEEFVAIREKNFQRIFDIEVQIPLAARERMRLSA